MTGPKRRYGRRTADARSRIGIRMQYGTDASSAFSTEIAPALFRHFNYSKEARLLMRESYDSQQWIDIIRDNLCNNRPIVYGGSGNQGGHSFVCDGIDENDYLHINWGWAGGADGFYASDALNPTMSKTYNFNNLTTVVYNIKPASTSAEWSPIHLTSDENQVGMTMDVTDIQPGTRFKSESRCIEKYIKQ